MEKTTITESQKAEALAVKALTKVVPDLAEIVYLGNKKRGFWEGEHNTGERLMLMVSELAEGLEADRKGRHSKLSPKDYNKLQAAFQAGRQEDFKEGFKALVKDTFEDELADVVIRVLDYVGGMGIPLAEHIQLKLMYNSTRPYKHGKKY